MRSRFRARAHVAAIGIGLLSTRSALAEDVEERSERAGVEAGANMEEAAINDEGQGERSKPPHPIVEPGSKQRATSVIPRRAEPPPSPKALLAADPITDGAMILAAGGFAVLLELINSTTEIRPQQISPDFDPSKLLWIDRIAVRQTVDTNAKLLSNVGLYTALGFAVLDPILTGVREKNVQSWLVDSIIYAESITLTVGVTTLAKFAVRRPRPLAYSEAEKHKDDPNYSNSDTDSALSFFSGHSSLAAAVSATATYLAFVRSPRSPRPWITLFTGVALTSFVGYERVRAGSHFPTDVIAGVLAGAAIGIVVPHLHRIDDVTQRRVWVGFAPERTGGGTVSLSGFF